MIINKKILLRILGFISVAVVLVDVGLGIARMMSVLPGAPIMLVGSFSALYCFVYGFDDIETSGIDSNIEI